MFAKEDLNQLNQLVEGIERRKSRNRESIAATYEDSPALKEIAAILDKCIDEEQESLVNAYEGYAYLGKNYTSLGRFSVAAEYRLKALKAALKVFEKFNFKPDEVDELFSNLLRDRNYYVNDDCLDIMELVKGCELLPLKFVNEVYESRMKRRRSLKNDPVEMSPKYLAVIDEVEEKIEKNRTMRGMGSCFEYWDLKAQYLHEKGIEWQTPFMLNPGVMFD